MPRVPGGCLGLCPKRWGWGLGAGGRGLALCLCPPPQWTQRKSRRLQKAIQAKRDSLWTQGPPLAQFPGILGPTLAPEWWALQGTGPGSVALGPLIC